MSIPRLELTAALMLVKCVVFVQKTLSLKTAPCYCWTDSTVILTWIKNHPSRWKSFVANRVYEIHNQLPNASWQHVPSASNPTDIASCGLSVSGLEACSLWWNGPEWLSLSSDNWPKQGGPPGEVSLEEKSPVSYHLTIDDDWNLASRFSSWTKLL